MFFNSQIFLIRLSSVATKIFDSINKFSSSSEIRYVGGCVRKIIQKEIVDDMTDIGAFAHLLRLEPAKASQSVVQKVTGETDALSVAAKQEIYTDIAKALTQIKGKEARTALKVIMRASKAEQVSDAELKAVSDLLLANSGFASIAAFSEFGQSQVNGEQ